MCLKSDGGGDEADANEDSNNDNDVNTNADNEAGERGGGVGSRRRPFA